MSFSEIGPSSTELQLLGGEDSNNNNKTRPVIGPYRPNYFSMFFWWLVETLFHITPKISKNNRMLYVGKPNPHARMFPRNIVRNQKYNLVTFLPLCLYEQFRYFFNMYFLVVAISQFYPPLQVGFLFTYVAPLVFVLAVSLSKEAFDDIQRWKRDRDANNEHFEALIDGEQRTITAADIRVGMLLILHKDQRVPADCVLLRTSEKTGASFVRTDQLDGETDWKLRFPLPTTQRFPQDVDVTNVDAILEVEAPHKEIYKFQGKVTVFSENGDMTTEPLSLENTLWCNCVVATGSVLALAIYTGRETRSALNANAPQSKMGLLDGQLNSISKFLFCIMVFLSLTLVAFQEFSGYWWISMTRFFLLFSSIIPISLRVNLDMAKALYSIFIIKDEKIPETLVRNSNIPEELGRIKFLFTDKTGTLTRNEMEFNKFIIGPQFKFESCETSEVQTGIEMYLAIHPELIVEHSQQVEPKRATSCAVLGWSENQAENVMMSALALALCHNVTPVVTDTGRSYQASSPDEVSLVKFCESCGLTLEERTLKTMTLLTPLGTHIQYEILMDFPFSSERKRMGIILRHPGTGRIHFWMKGADAIMTKIVSGVAWLDEECVSLAREGLRTLVFGVRELSQAEYDNFVKDYKTASAILGEERANAQARVLEDLEKGLDLVGISGVEDRLQEDVQTCLERFRFSGIQVWMLTGDKIETATCIARSTRMVSPRQHIFTLQCTTPLQASEGMTQLADLLHAKKDGVALIIDGTALHVLLLAIEKEFVETSRGACAVVVARCSPTQKAQVVTAVRKYILNTWRTAAIGDGGNDVSMILAAHVGVGIVGKEGKHASLAADFSITQFSHVFRLVMWHGRMCYNRSCRLGQFIIHRGFVISIIQLVFSAMFNFSSVPIYTGWLIVGYATVFTMFPVFALVLDEDVSEETVALYPELYDELQKGRALCTRSLLVWMWKSVYQAGVIMVGAMVLFDETYLRLVSITFTSLILSELLAVGLEIHQKVLFQQRRLHLGLFYAAESLSLLMYFMAFFIVPEYFDQAYIFTKQFWSAVAIVCFMVVAPMFIMKTLGSWLFPAKYSKLR